MTLKDIGEAAAALDPGGANRKAIAQSWFGSLMGQATTAVLLVAGYLAALGLLHRFVGPELDRFRDTNPWLFWAALAVPLVAVAIFSVVPTILRGFRERRLHALIRNDAPVAPGYFRLTPYEEGEPFSRPDGATDRVLHWIESTRCPVLYLSGASGSGKTSLVQAGIAPSLRRAGWEVAVVRGMGRPLHRFTEQTVVFYSRLEDRTDESGRIQFRFDIDGAQPMLTGMLERIGARRQAEGKKPLLMVLDQFEEYLLHDDDSENPAEVSRDAYARFITEVDRNPMPGIRILHVFREDYRALLFKYDLPRYIPGETGFELAPFSRSEAQAFLEAGPRTFDARGFERLFSGLDRIEETRGLYRPITLNMVGFVMAQQGAALDTDPGRLIETYLTRAIASGPSRDFARPVLEAMITSAGTKEARSEAALAGATGIADWQVRATLADLQADGLVRPLSGGLWEISHDFLARLIGQITGRLRRPWLTRIATPMLALTAAGWLVAIGLGLPVWTGWQEARARTAIHALGFAELAGPDGGISYQLSRTDMLTDATWPDFVANARLLPVTELSLASADGITRLDGLDGLSGLQSLDLSGAERIGSLDGIEKLAGLVRLDLSCTADWLEVQIAISNCRHGLSLEPLRSAPALSSLALGDTAISDLSPVDCTRLKITGATPEQLATCDE